MKSLKDLEAGLMVLVGNLEVKHIKLGVLSLMLLEGGDGPIELVVAGSWGELHLAICRDL